MHPAALVLVAFLGLALSWPLVAWLSRQPRPRWVLALLALAGVLLAPALAWRYAGLDLALVVGYAGALLVCAGVDLVNHRIPNVVVVPALALALALLVSPWWGPGLPSALAGGLLAGGFFLVGYLLRWNGMGDVKLALFVGLVLGFPGLVYPLGAGLLAGGVVAWTRILVGRRKKSMPYGPYIALGGLLGLAWPVPGPPLTPA